MQNAKEIIDSDIKRLQDKIIPIFKKLLKPQISYKDGINSQAHIYIQLNLLRCIELIEGLISSAENKHPLIAASCARTLIETVVSFNAFHMELKTAMEKVNQEEVHETILKYILATRNKELINYLGEDFKHHSTNILTQIDNVSKRNPSCKKDYDRLSGIVHPNYEGLCGLYGTPENNKMIFSKEEQAYEVILESIHISHAYLKSLAQIFNDIVDLIDSTHNKED